MLTFPWGMLTYALSQGFLSGFSPGDPGELKPGQQSLEPEEWAVLSAGKGTGGRTPGAPATHQPDNFE